MKPGGIIFIFLTIFIFTCLYKSIDASANNPEPPCLSSLAVPLPHEEIHRFENGSLLHEGLVYPPHLYWHDDNLTYGCACEVQENCLRKCCQYGEVLSDNIRPECIKLPENKTIPEIFPEPHQLADEIRNLSKITDRFVLIKNRLCTNVAYKLQPEEYDEDKFVLEADGTLSTKGTKDVLPQWKYCMDLHEDLRKITVLVCHEPEIEPVTAETTIYPVGIVISIPFLLATFVVYAIIPELKNLYGMTLMCYVACLVAAYSFLAGGRLVYHGQPLCVVMGKLNTRFYNFFINLNIIFE